MFWLYRFRGYYLLKCIEWAFLACVQPRCVLCLKRCSFLCTLYCYSMEAPLLCPSVCRNMLSPSGLAICLSTLYLCQATVCRGLLRLPWPLHLGCDMLAVAQRRQSFSVLLLLSSVIKGRGKSRGGGWALIAFHGREERAAACPEGLRRCWALCCLLCPPDGSCSRKTHTFVLARHWHTHAHTHVNILKHILLHTHARSHTHTQKLREAKITSVADRQTVLIYFKECPVLENLCQYEVRGAEAKL